MSPYSTESCVRFHHGTEGTGGEHLRLSTNFRSKHNLISFTNFLFGKLFGEHSDPAKLFNPPPQNLEAGKENTGDDSSSPQKSSNNSIEITLFSEEETENDSDQPKPPSPSERLFEIESRLIATRCRSLVDEGTPADTITILLRTMNNFPAVSRALTEKGLLFQTYKGGNFFLEEEVVDISIILECIDNPDAPENLGALFRIPAFGIADESIFSFLFGTDINDRRDREKIEQLRGLTDKFHAVKDAVTIDETIEGFLSESGYRPNNILNVKKLREMAKSRQNESGLTLSEFICNLRLARDLNIRENAPTSALDSNNMIKIMTIHAAKGLEFDTVFVPNLKRLIDPKSENIYLDDEAGLAINLNRKTRPLLHHLASGNHRERELAEAKRLLYVALTRAKERLILYLPHTEKPPASFNTCRSYADWLTFLIPEITDGVKAADFDYDGKFTALPYESKPQITTPEKPASSEKKPTTKAGSNCCRYNTHKEKSLQCFRDRNPPRRQRPDRPY